MRDDSPWSVLVPWDRPSAHRAQIALTSTITVLTTMSVLLRPPSSFLGWVEAGWFPLALGSLVFALIYAGDSLPSAVYSVPPLVGVLLFPLMSFHSNMSLAADQIFLCLAVLYMSSQLRGPLPLAGLVAVLLCDLIIAFSKESTGRALQDLAFACPTYIASFSLLGRAGREQRRLADELRQQAEIDPLTKLATRSVLDKAAQSALAASGTSGTALILLDVDNFKFINDTFGHPVGDDVLLQIADTVASSCRQDSVISRIGGDEIAILLPGCGLPVAVRRAEQLVSKIGSTPLRLPSGKEVQISVSGGVAHAPTGYTDHLRGLYTMADAALYDAKSGGRSRVGLPDPVHLKRNAWPETESSPLR